MIESISTFVLGELGLDTKVDPYFPRVTNTLRAPFCNSTLAKVTTFTFDNESVDDKISSYVDAELLNDFTKRRSSISLGII